MMKPSPEQGLWQSYLDRVTIDRHAARTALDVTIVCDAYGRDGGTRTPDRNLRGQAVIGDDLESDRSTAGQHWS